MGGGSADRAGTRSQAMRDEPGWAGGRGGEARSRGGKGLRDVDSVLRAQSLLPLAWFLFVAALAMPAALVGAGYLGASPVQAILLALLFTASVAGLFYLLWYPLVIGGAVRLFGRIYGVEGEGKEGRTYWRAQALAARGAVGEAVAAYADAARRHPDDPVPCLRAAALCERELGDPSAAVKWYLRARRTGALAAGTDAHVTRRLIDLYASRPGHERQAQFECRRMLTLHGASPHASGARERLASLERGVQELAGRHARRTSRTSGGEDRAP